MGIRFSHCLLSIALAAMGCAKPINDHTFPSHKIIPKTKQHTLSISSSASPIKMLYIGSGHLIIEYNNEMILIDPFFSIQPFSPTKIKTKIPDFEKYKSVLDQHAVDISKSKSTWISHTHYDHMMDIPLLLKENLLPKSATIYGNEFGDDILQNFITPDQYHSIKPTEMYNPLGANAPLRWFDSTSSIRVLPILSNHAPHLKIFGIKVRLMTGKIKGEYFKENFKTEEAKTKKGQWREGCAYSFLIDFVKAGKIEYRIFIQTSSSDFPLGRPPDELLNDRPVDLVVLCLASSNNVKEYPMNILKALNPKKVVFVHWEDFFISSSLNANKLVRFTNFRKIDRKLRKANLTPNVQDYVMPQPGTMITIN